MKRFFALFFVLLLASCIAVKDYGAYWAEGVADPALQGVWNSARKGGMGVEFLLDGQNYQMIYHNEGKTSYYAKTLTINGNQTFLMTKKKLDDKGGTMIPYIIQDGKTLVFFAPDKDKADVFSKQYSLSTIHVARSGLTIDILDYNAIKILEGAAQNSSLWKEMRRFER